MTDCLSSSTDCQRPYGQAMRQVCSRKYVKLYQIAIVVMAMTTKPVGWSQGDCVTQTASCSVPTKYARNVCARKSESTAYTAYLATRRGPQNLPSRSSLREPA
jgi:hypothetical protein